MRKPRRGKSRRPLGRIRKIRLTKSGVMVLPWREAWAEAGEPWIEWIEVYWGQRSPNDRPGRPPIKPDVSARELWLRFVSKKRPLRSAKRKSAKTKRRKRRI